MSKNNEKTEAKVRSLHWERNTTTAVDTWEAVSPLGRFTVARRFIGNEMYMCTPPLNGVVHEISCVDFDDGIQKAEGFIRDLIAELSA